MKALNEAKQLLEAEIAKMTKVISDIDALNGIHKVVHRRKKHTISAAGRKRIAAAARARWAKVKAARKGKAA